EFKKHIWRYAQMFASLNVLKELQKHYKTDPNPKDPLKGIIWHTQGSGKSLTMVWLTKWLRSNIKQARILIVTDRRELDAQIQGVFEGIGEPIYRADFF
ncbi:DEAD/DEAH box helicase family protein, partial [Helicobacter pylori]|uniref:DEAD/DEAH box helicase family protein n=1 Tax=Helicobacter pylori TaxID=210 RepID=UPI001F507A20